MADTEAIAEGYTTGHRLIEIAAIAAFFGCEIVLIWNLVHVAAGPVWTPFVAAFLAFVTADVLSGIVHWAGDTWGSRDVPVFGPNFIRPFRHHHVDEVAICRHDFVAVNGNSCVTTLLGLVPALFVPVAAEHHWRAFGLWFIVFLAMALFATNQFHKWSHAEEVPAVVSLLHRARLILPPDHHKKHHTLPYDGNYCMTTGWCNPLLDGIGFFRRAERLITWLTGALPRRDEIRVLVNEGRLAADGANPTH